MPQPEPLPLGPGWEGAERALADVQADLSRTVPGAPQLLLLWYVDEDTGERHAYVGKARDWYFGGNGGFTLSPDYADALVSIATQLQDAVVDTILGYLTYWPLCPEHASFPLGVAQTEDSRWSWVCARAGGRHTVSLIGQLGLEPNGSDTELPLDAQ